MDHANERRAQARRTEEGLSGATAEEVCRGGQRALERSDDRVREHVEVLRVAESLACTEGCSHCCHMEVSASFPEIARLASFIEETFSAADREALSARVDAQCASLRPLSTLERLTRSTACAVLVDGRCSAYEARPLACRGWNSADVAPCIVALEMPGAMPSVPVHRVLRDSSAAIADGVGDGVRAAGFDSALLDLPHALQSMLRDAAGITHGWLAGEMLPAVMKATLAPEQAQGTDGLWRPVAK